MLRLQNVSKSYLGAGAKVQALGQLSLSIRKGEIHAIMGPSGCGKSTLLHIIAGFEASDTGEVSLDEQSISLPGCDRVMVFQNDVLYEFLNAQRNVEFGLVARWIRGPGSRSKVFSFVSSNARRLLLAIPGCRQLVLRHQSHQWNKASSIWLSKVGLAGFERKLPKQLSGGMRKRVELARAFILQPQVLLMDEPFGSLDTITKSEMHGLVEQLWSELNSTIVFTTHDPSEVIALADKVTVLSSRPGKVVSTIEVSLPRPRTAAVRRSSAAVDLTRQLEDILVGCADPSQENEVKCS